jgi:hypothetical protein
MGLKNKLFGKGKIISDEKLGNLKARIKNNYPSKNYTWLSEVILEEKEKKLLSY